MSTTSHRDLVLPCSLLEPLLLYLMYPSVYQCLEVWLAFLLFNILTFVLSKPPILPGLCHLTIPLSTTLPTTIIFVILYTSLIHERPRYHFPTVPLISKS